MVSCVTSVNRLVDALGWPCRASDVHMYIKISAVDVIQFSFCTSRQLLTSHLVATTSRRMTVAALTLVFRTLDRQATAEVGAG